LRLCIHPAQQARFLSVNAIQLTGARKEKEKRKEKKRRCEVDADALAEWLQLQ
jgi:hypothetical protein